MKTLQNSKDPIKAISLVALPGKNHPHVKYESGYEHFFNILPVLEDNDPELEGKVLLSEHNLNALSNELLK